MPRYSRSIAEAHLKALGRKHEITIRWVSGRNWIIKSWAHADTWKVEIPRPYAPRQYLVGLHEFGHLLGTINMSERAKLGVVTEGEYGLLGEMSAWIWASLNVHRDLYEAIDQKTFDSLVGPTLTSHLWDLSMLAAGQQ